MTERDRYGYNRTMQASHPLITYRNSHTPPMRRAELARRLKVSKTTVARWEEGVRKIDEELVPGISSITGIPAKELRPDAVEKHERIFGESQEPEKAAAEKVA